MNIGLVAHDDKKETDAVTSALHTEEYCVSITCMRQRQLEDW